MSLTNPNTPVSQQDLQDFYHKLLPYMGGGSGGGGGHTIEDSEGTDLTQRDTLQFGTGLNANDDSTNEKTVITPDVMQSGDMDDVLTPLPSVAPKKEGIKYSTTEQVIGEWIDGKPLYQKTIDFGTLPNNTSKDVAHNISNIDRIVYSMCISIDSNKNAVIIPKYDLGNYLWSIALNISATNVTITTKEDYSPQSAVITLQYTKTTD